MVRFRSVAGSAKEIAYVFFAMAVGLATGMGYIGYAIICTLIIGTVMIVFSMLKIGGSYDAERELRITIPESLDYTGVFDEIFEKYLSSYTLTEVRTSNMGSLFRLKYTISFKDANTEKKMIDDIRCRNGNLEVSCGRAEMNREIL